MGNGDTFVEKWRINANDLFEGKIYECASSMISKYEKIVEIGCGTGHSTLSLLLNGHKVFAIDICPECIRETKNLIQNIGYSEASAISWANEDATLMCTNLFETEFVNKIICLDFDAIVIWNPGQMDRIKLVDQCAIIAKSKNVPLQVMERADSNESAQQILDEIAYDNKITLVNKMIVPVKWDHVNGIRMEGTSSDSIYMAIGLYRPTPCDSN